MSQMGNSHRPNVSAEDAKLILKNQYNRIAAEIKELNAYDDRNFWIKLPEGENDVVLKVTNEEDSKKFDLIQAQTDLLATLGKLSFKCPEPISLPNGKLLQLLTISGKQHVVRLLKFVLGEVLNVSPPGSNYLYFEAGVYIGKLNKVMQGFDSTVFQNFRHQWMLEEAVKALEHISVVTDLQRRKMVECVLDRFNKEVLLKRDQFRIGLIHGDFNEFNIIINKNEFGSLHVDGVIDFGDVCYSYLIFDVVIAMTYMIIHSGNIQAGGYVLKGFITEQAIPANEKRVISLCIQARLCQSVVNGLYYYSLNPDNEYILSSQKAGWNILEQLFNLDDAEVVKSWEDNEYSLWCK